MKTYDYLIVGAGLFGSTFAYLAGLKGKSCLVVERRNAPGGMMRCIEKDGIQIHKFGPHIFHTSNKKVWGLISSLIPLKPYILEVHTIGKSGKIYDMPPNENTIRGVYGTSMIGDRLDFLDTPPQNLEEYAMYKFGISLFDEVIEGYTEKMWGMKCRDLPISILERLPVKEGITDNNYFPLDKYQALPESNSWNELFDILLGRADVKLRTSFKPEFLNLARTIIYTGPIDEYYNYSLGKLGWRSLEFVQTRVESPTERYPILNDSQPETRYTRITDYGLLGGYRTTYTWKVSERPRKDQRNPYYPIKSALNLELYSKYLDLNSDPNLIFSGRLGGYTYSDMDETIEAAMDLAKKLL